MGEINKGPARTLLVQPVNSGSLVEVTNWGAQVEWSEGWLSLASACWVNSEAGGRLTLLTAHSGTSTLFPLSSTAHFPTGWREGASSQPLEKSLLITGPHTPSPVPHHGGYPDAHPCHPGLHHSSFDPGALTPGAPITRTHGCPSAAPRISHEEPYGSLFILPESSVPFSLKISPVRKLTWGHSSE